MWIEPGVSLYPFEKESVDLGPLISVLPHFFTDSRDVPFKAPKSLNS